MNTPIVEKVIKILENEVKQWKVPVVGVIAEELPNRPYVTLVSTLLSLRTKDQVTLIASRKLLQKATNFQELLKLSEKEIVDLIYPVLYYKVKAKNLRLISEIIINKYKGEVPKSLDLLLELPGVGRKTANLVMTVGFDEYGICVDVHVHRIFNRLGFVKTKTPDETELVLRDKLPKKYWKEINGILVAFGQNLCVPVSPWCSRCPVYKYCERVGVTKSR